MSNPFPLPCAIIPQRRSIEQFTVVYLVAKPLIWSEAESDHVVIEINI